MDDVKSFKVCPPGFVGPSTLSVVKLSDHMQALDAQRLRADTAEAELEDMQHWRDLALQFDHHRMRTMFHLKTLVSDGAHWDTARDFINEPPLPSHEVVAKLAAAEQHIAELSADNQLLRKLLEQTLAALNPAAKLSKSIRAALNPNPEAESHESSN